MSDVILENTVNSFNQRLFKEAVHYSAEGLARANGQDEAFWMGLNEIIHFRLVKQLSLEVFMI